MTPADAPDTEAPGTGEQPAAPLDINDAHVVRQRNRDIKRKDERADEALKALMLHADGRLLVWGMLEDCSVFGSTFSGEATHASAFNEGQRNVGLKLFLRLMKLCPDLYATMQKENGK